MKYAIITYSGVHYLITAEQELALRDKHLDEELEIDGSILKVKNISDILTIEKYHETYPQRTPGRELPEFNKLPGMGMEGIIKNSHETAIKGMVAGLKKYISSDRYQGTEAPLELLKQMEKKLI